MSEAVARGSLVLSLDAQQLNAGLKKTAAQAKVSGSEFAKNFKAESSGKIGEIFGGGSALALGAKAGAAGLAVAGVATLGKELWDLVSPAKAFHKEIERGRELSAKWAAGITAGIGRIKESLSEFSGIEATPEGLAALRGQIAGLNKEFNGTTQSLKLARTESEKWESKWNDPESFQHWLVGELETTAGAAKENVATMKAAYDEQLKALTELRKKERELMNPSDSVAARTALRQFVKEQTDAVADLTRTAEEAKLARLQDRFGFTDAALAGARAAISMKNMALATKEADDLISALTADVNLFGDAVKKTSDDVKLDELVKKGVDEKQLARIRQLIDWKKRLNETYSPLQGLERGTAAEISFQNKSRFEEANRQQVKQEQDLLRQQVGLLQKIAFGIAGIKLDKPEF